MSTGDPQSHSGRLVFRPTPAMSLAALLALVILVALGTWQMQRLAWKTDLIARMVERLAAPPVPLPAELDDPAAWEWRRVEVTGTFRHDSEFHLGPRMMPGPDGLPGQGVHVFTPLLRPEGSPILVDRGFVPLDRRDPDSRAAGQPDGSVTVIGIVRLPTPPGWMQPANKPAENVWFGPDLPAMAAAAGLDSLAPVLVAADATPNSGGLPVGGRTQLTVRNDHLGYALTWYGLALTLVGVWIAASLRRVPPP